MSRPRRHLRAGAQLTRAAIVALIAAFLSLQGIAPARAQKNNSLELAKKEYQRGSKLYAAQSYERALEAFQSAYTHQPIPGLLYNIGQCYRRLGNFELAIEKYSAFLDLATAAPPEQRRIAHQHITEMTRALSQAKRDDEAKQKQKRDREIVGQETKTKKSNGSAASEPPIYKKWWFWAGAGVVAAGATGTLILLNQPPSPPSSDGGNFRASNL